MSERTKGRLELGRYGSMIGGPMVRYKHGKAKSQVAAAMIMQNRPEDDPWDVREANARHVVACWNAVEDLGLTTEQLDAGVLRELVAALRLIRDGDYGNAHDCKAAAKVARDVLAKIGGGS